MEDLLTELEELYEKLRAEQEQDFSAYRDGYLDAIDYILQALEVYLG